MLGISTTISSQLVHPNGQGAATVAKSNLVHSISGRRYSGIRFTRKARQFLFPITQNPQDTATYTAYFKNYHLKPDKLQWSVFRTIVTGFCYISLKITELYLVGHCVALKDQTRMSNLKINRVKRNLTQEELSDKSGISVRTIQRIESGNDPKGQTLKRLADTLGINENELLEKEEAQTNVDTTLFKIINISSLPFTIIPPANIIIPLIIMFAKKKFNPLAKQIISIQILWLIFAFMVFMLSAFSKNWFSLGNSFMLVIMIFLVLINVVIILRNAIEIDKKGKLFFKLDFSLI